MRKLFALACAFVVATMFLPADSASAQEAAWRITAMEGVVRVHQPGRDLSDATVNQMLRAGSAVTTGAGSSATLDNGGQRIVMTANSRMTLAVNSTDGMTRILQDLGSLLFQVDHRETQHFRVETPLLAAVVKGTTFTVSVGPQQDQVHVAHGLVEVRANAGSAVNDVPSGVTARVDRGAPDAIAMTTPEDASAAALGVAAPALDYAEASGGVVDAAFEGRANAGGSSANANGGSGANAESNNHGDGRNLFGQSVAAVRSLFASLNGNNGNHGDGNNGNHGDGNNGNHGDGNNGNSGSNGNNGNNGNGNPPEAPPEPPEPPEGGPP